MRRTLLLPVLPALAVLAALPAAAAPRGGKARKADDADGKPVLHWDCDAAPPRAPELVVEKSPSGSALGGFRDESIALSGLLPNATAAYPNVPEAWTFQCFVRDPLPLTNRVALVARFSDGAAAEPVVPWQLWIERSGAVCLGVEDPKSVRTATRHAGAPWRPGVWHHVAVVRELGEKDASGERPDRYRVWIVPLVPQPPGAAAAAAKPLPVLDAVFRTKAGRGRATALFVGGGVPGKHPEIAPGGALGGAVDEVSLWYRAFSEDELAADRAAFLRGASPAEEAAKPPVETLLHWTFGEAGKNPRTVDGSGRGCDGRSAGSVRGGAPGRGMGKAFDGFSSEESAVSSKPLPEHAFRGDWTLLAWVRNPRLSSKQACVLASTEPDGRRNTVAWRLWFDGKGAPHVGAQDASSRRYAGEGSPVRFEPGKWHLVALSHRRGPGPQGGERDFFRVFVVPDGARGAPPAPALDWSYGGGKLAAASMLRLGAGAESRSKTVENAPAGWFGGQIAEAMLLSGRALDADEIAALARGKSLADPAAR